MSSSSKFGDDADFALALSKFPLAPWLARHGFVAQGRAKLEWLHDCPWCGAEDKLSVNPSRKFWRCFVCAKQFQLLDLLAAFDGGHAAAAEIVRASSGGRSLTLIPEDYLEATAPTRPSTWEPAPIAPPESFAPLVAHIDYTARRGLDLDNMRRLGVGVCSWGRYQDRLVFPVRRWDGHWIYFQSRATWEKREHDEATSGKYRKNLNPANDDPMRFASAGDVVLGLELLNGATRVALVEGPTDLVQSLPCAVATFGKKISERQIMLLARAGVREVDIAWDPDAWISMYGRPSPAVQAAQRLALHFTVRTVQYPEGVDPGNLTPPENIALRWAAPIYGAGSRLERIP